MPSTVSGLQSMAPGRAASAISWELVRKANFTIQPLISGIRSSGGGGQQPMFKRALGVVLMPLKLENHCNKC